MVCPACGTAAASTDQRFCGHCGAALTETRETPIERRLVSVLFCDLVGFTTFSEARDPEDVRETLGEYFALARRVIGDYGGTVEKFIGDAVMAVWGAPVAREDDAERAVRAGLGLTAAVAALARRLAISELRVRVGVLTGEAAVELGRVHEGMVIGDTVNTAARLQALADPGSVFVDDVTRLACERSIAFEAAGVHEVKGKTVPVRAWRAVRVLARVGGVGPGRAVEPPFVGRDAALEALRDAVARLLGDAAGTELITIVGEAGIGKSRLVWEFEAHVDGIAARVAWHLGRASSFGRGAAFSPLAEMVRARASIEPDDPIERQRRQATRLLDRLFGAGAPTRAAVQRAVFRLLELDDGEQVIEPGELFTAWRMLFAAIAARAPVVLAFEELQEADDALLDFIRHLLDWAQFPLLILAVSRPDSRVDALPNTTRIELSPLAPDEMEMLLTGAVKAPPTELLEAIRAEGGGIPLYAVETLRSLADRGVLAVEDARYVVRGELGELTIAPTIRALIASRLDGLGTLERRVLTAGAIIGDRFAAAAAADVAEIDAPDALALLGGLVSRAFLISEDGSAPTDRARYAFLQGAVRRVALSALSRRERRRLHLGAADHLDVSLEPERAAAVAAHLVAAMEADPRAADVAEIRGRARGALQRAAERAAAVGALGDARSLYDRCIELTDDESARASLLESAGLVAFRAGDAEAAGERYAAAAELHGDAGRRREELAARTQRLRYLQYERSPESLLPQLRELDAELAGVDDRASALAAATLSFTLYQLGRPGEALEAASRGVRIAESCEDWPELLHALAQQASALAELQRPDEAIGVYRRALAIAEDREPRLLAILWDNVAISLASIGRHREAIDAAHEAIAAAERFGERIAEQFARLVLGRARCSLGEWDAAIADVDSVRADIPSIQVGMALAPLVVIALGRGDEERARALVAEHDARCNDGGVSVYESDFRALRRTVLADSPSALARIIPDAEVADFAEWSGWVATVVDALVAAGEPSALAAALDALRTEDPMKQTAPVQAQAQRLAGHLAAMRGDREAAAASLSRAAALAAECELAFERAVIAVERCELTGDASAPSLQSAREAFTRAGARQWLERAERLSALSA